MHHEAHTVSDIGGLLGFGVFDDVVFEVLDDELEMGMRASNLNRDDAVGSTNVYDYEEAGFSRFRTNRILSG